MIVAGELSAVIAARRPAHLLELPSQSIFASDDAALRHNFLVP